MPAAARHAQLRLFLDAGVLIDGLFNQWGTCKGVLILTTLRQQFHAVIADPISAEVNRAIEKKTAMLPTQEAEQVRAAIAGWFSLCRPERCPWPTVEELRQHAGLLAAVRHRHDMPSIVAAVATRPDWVLSTNTDHWNQELAARTGLRIATPREFLGALAPTLP